MTQDEAERAEAEAREELWNYARTDERVRGFRDAIEAYTEAVRTTERLKAEALASGAQELFEAFGAHDSITASNYGPMLTPRLSRALESLRAALAAYRGEVSR